MKPKLLGSSSNRRPKALQELEESGEGYQYGVKSVLEQKNRGKLEGIIGTVSQLIKVPQHLEKSH